MMLPALVAFGLLAALPVAAASWHSVADPKAEPDTTYDITGGHMFLDPYTGSGERVYFNVFLSLTPTGSTTGAGSYHAYLGAWKDCNGDGYIGSSATGTETYRSELLLSPAICPVGSLHNSGTTVRELLWIGPGSSDINDADALAWADDSAPDAPHPGPAKTAADSTLAFTNGAPAARWSGTETFSGGPRFITGFAHVSPSVVASWGLQLPGTTGSYGAEQCGAFTTGIHNGWDCDPSHWPGTVKVGQPYELRDVDCTSPDPSTAPC